MNYHFFQLSGHAIFYTEVAHSKQLVSEDFFQSLGSVNGSTGSCDLDGIRASLYNSKKATVFLYDATCTSVQRAERQI